MTRKEIMALEGWPLSNAVFKHILNGECAVHPPHEDEMAAFFIVKKMREPDAAGGVRRFSMSVDDECWFSSFWYANDYVYTATGSSAPEAICRAALLAHFDESKTTGV